MIAGKDQDNHISPDEVVESLCEENLINIVDRRRSNACAEVLVEGFIIGKYQVVILGFFHVLKNGDITLDIVDYFSGYSYLEENDYLRHIVELKSPKLVLGTPDLAVYPEASTEIEESADVAAMSELALNAQPMAVTVIGEDILSEKSTRLFYNYAFTPAESLRQFK